MNGQAALHGHLIGGYLDEIARRLPGPRVHRRVVIDELRDGLFEAAAVRQRLGAPPAEAARLAIDEFGTPEQVAAAHVPELALQQARHSALRVVVLLLVAGLTWHAYATLVGYPQAALPDSGLAREVFLVLTAAIKWIPLIAQLGAVGLLLVTPRLRPEKAPDRRRLAGLATLVTATMGATLLLMAAIVAVSAPEVWRSTRALVVPTLTAPAVWAFVVSASATARCRAAMS